MHQSEGQPIRRRLQVTHVFGQLYQDINPAIILDRLAECWSVCCMFRKQPMQEKTMEGHIPLKPSTEKEGLSPEATEVVEMINEMATELMFYAYDHLPVGVRMKLSDLTKNTQRVLEESQGPPA